jgi:hypothetical protein
LPYQKGLIVADSQGCETPLLQEVVEALALLVEPVAVVG